MDISKDIKKATNDKSKAIQKKDLKEVISYCGYLGELYSKRGQYEEAIDQYLELLDCGRRLKDNLEIAFAYRLLGECYSELGERYFEADEFDKAFKNALNYQEKYLSIVNQLNNTVEIQRAWATLGRTYFMQHSKDSKRYFEALQQAETSHLKALNLTDRLEDTLTKKDLDEMRCRAFLNLGLVYDQKGDKEKCKSFLERATKLASYYDFKEDLHRCQVSLASFYSSIDCHKEAIKMYDLAIKSAKQLNSRPDLLDTWMGKANTLISIKDYQSARYCFKKAYYVYKEDCEENLKAKQCLKLIDKIMMKIEEMNRCNLNKKKIKICDELGDLFADEQIKCYSNAIEYYSQELEIALDENLSKEELAPIYLSLGQTYLDNEQYTEALFNFKKEIECNVGRPKEIIFTTLKIIETKCAIHRNNEEIIEEFNILLRDFCVNSRLKKLVYKSYLDFLKEIDECELYEDLIKQVKIKLDTLSKEQIDDEDSNDQQQTVETDDNEIEIVLSDVSTDDSENEENLVERGRGYKRKKSSDEKKNDRGETPLHQACIEGNLKKVESFIEKGHRINTKDNAGWTPLHEASNHGYTDIVELLIKNGANLNDSGDLDRKVCKGITPIHDACTNGHISVIRLLLRAGANVCCVDESGNTPLDHLKEYLRKNINNFTEYEKKDYQMMVNELKEEMIKKGFDEKKINEKRTMKRPYSSINEPSKNPNLLEELSNRIDNRSKRSTMLESPPNKTNRFDRPNSFSSTSGLRKNTDHCLEIIINEQSSRTTNSTRSKPPPRIESLIEEENLISDDWLEDDLGVHRNNRKLASDPFERRESNENNRMSNSSTRKRNYDKNNEKKSSKKNLVNENDLLDYNFDSDIEMDDFPQLDHTNQNDQSTVNEEAFEIIDDDVNSLSSGTSETTNFNINSNDNFTNKRMRRKQTKIKNYFNSDKQTMKSNERKKDDVILVSSKVVDSKKADSQQPIVSKLKVHVHIDNMILLIPLPNRNVSIGWLMNETIERYYSFKKIRPVVQLKTMEGALLSNDDQVIDVLTNMELKVEIDSFNIKPINELYNELCKNENVNVVNELDYEFRISMASGCLNLRNCFLDEQQFKLIMNSLRMQSKIRMADLSYSNLIKLDDSCELIKMTLTNLSNLEILNLECTGLTRQHLIEISKCKSSKLQNLNLNYNFLLNCVDSVCDLIESNTNLKKLSLQYTDLTDQLILNLRLNQLIEKRSNLQIHIDTLKNSKSFLSSSFVSSSLDILEANETDYLEFNKKLFIS